MDVRRSKENLAQPCSAALRVIEINPQTDPRCEAFVAAHPKGLIYHHPTWLEVLGREYGRKAVVLACEDVDRRIRGILPLLETQGLPFNVGRQRIGPRLSSLPRTPVAGPLSLDHQATVALAEAAAERVHERPGTQLQFKVQSPQLDGVVEGLVGSPWRSTYVLELPEHPEQLRFGNSRNHARIKWAVNKATRMGVEIRPAETEQELRAWYQLYLETMRWHVVPPRSYRFFRACWELLRPRGIMRLMLAEQREGGRSKLLAGSIFLMFGQTIFYAFNGRRQADLPLRPNDAIHWQGLHDACRDGFRYYDFGEVVEDNQGLAEFKGKWGTEPRQLYRYYYPAPQDLESGSDESDSYVHRLTTAAWRRLPLKATALLGDRIYNYL